MRRGGVLNAAVVGAAAVVLLGGCSSSIAERSYQGVPEGSAPVLPSAGPSGGTDLPDPDLGPRVQWAGNGDLLAVSLGGSSTCPVEPTKLVQLRPDRLRVEIAQRPGWFFGACTADLAIKTYEIRIPDSVTTEERVTVRVGEREFTLGPRGSGA